MNARRRAGLARAVFGLAKIISQAHCCESFAIALSGCWARAQPSCIAFLEPCPFRLIQPEWAGRAPDMGDDPVLSRLTRSKSAGTGPSARDPGSGPGRPP